MKNDENTYEENFLFLKAYFTVSKTNLIKLSSNIQSLTLFSSKGLILEWFRILLLGETFASEGPQLTLSVFLSVCPSLSVSVCLSVHLALSLCLDSKISKFVVW